MRKIAILLLVLSFFLFSCSKSNPSNSISSIPNTTGEQQPYQSSTQLNEENQTLPENSSDQSDYEEARRLAEERFKQQQTLAQSQFNNQLDATISQWEELSKDIEHLWEEQYRKSQEEFIKTQNLVRKIWGEAIFPTQKQWIEFSEDFKTFSNVNFDESGGFLQIKTIVDKDASDEEIKKNIDEQLKLIMNKIDPVTNKPILGDLVVVPPNLIVVDPPEKILQPIKLSNIDFRRISNNKIFWNKVEKASGYEINVYYNNNKVYSNITENIEYDLSAFLTNQSAGFYTVKIITIGNGIEYLNSDEYEIPQKLIKTQKLGTPSTIEWDTNVVRWNKIENTKEYKVKLFKNNSLLEEKTTTQENIDFSAIISKSGVGTFEVSVQAIGDGQIYLNSDEKRAEKTREIIKYLDQVKSPSWQRNTLVWEKVDSIREYNIKIFKDNQLIHQVTSRVENIDLDKIIQDNGVGSYYATVQAIGDGRFYRNGAESVNSSINIIRIKLPEVQNLTFKNMKASWRLVEKATGYELLLFKNQFLINTITLNKNTFEYDLTQLIETSGDGRYTVRIQTKGDGRFYTNSDVTDFSEFYDYKKVVEEKEDYDKVIYTLTIPLVDNFLETRVLSYKEIIEQYAEELNVSPEFIMAIIHTESSFNPNAVSGSGAVGLMQVIPKFGGAEGYYEIHGEMKVHEPDFFFDPETGVKYGTAYLKRLAERYFKEMTEETKRHFLVITSYNWGPTNIRNLARENQVENLTEMELYELLRDQTREETKNYIERVLTRQEMYKRTYYGDR